MLGMAVNVSCIGCCVIVQLIPEKRSNKCPLPLATLLLHIYLYSLLHHNIRIAKTVWSVHVSYVRSTKCLAFRLYYSHRFVFNCARSVSFRWRVTQILYNRAVLRQNSFSSVLQFTQCFSISAPLDVNHSTHIYIRLKITLIYLISFSLTFLFGVCQFHFVRQQIQISCLFFLISVFTISVVWNSAVTFIAYHEF